MKNHSFNAEKCNACPRKCNAVRPNGYCKMPSDSVYVARSAPHYGEEPCISGTRGSGTVFFTGCNLGCVFCQNYKISHEKLGRKFSVPELRKIFLALCESGVHNINLVTPSHYTDAVCAALAEGLPVPVAYNSSGYDSIEALKKLAGKIQIYMPDLKYSSDELAKKYSACTDYTKTAQAAILEMYRQVGRYKLNPDGILQSGMIIRHLVLPGQLENTYGVIDWIADNFPRHSVLVSLMGQYTPIAGIADRMPELNRCLTAEEYSKAETYLALSGIEDGYLQEPEAAGEEHIPGWDGENEGCEGYDGGKVCPQTPAEQMRGLL